jgi:hypothetical protein
LVMGASTPMSQSGFPSSLSFLSDEEYGFFFKKGLFL